VQAEIDYPSLGLKRGEFAHVVARPDHRVLLEREDGARVAWEPAVATRLGVFVPEVQPLAVGGEGFRRQSGVTYTASRGQSRPSLDCEHLGAAQRPDCISAARHPLHRPRLEREHRCPVERCIVSKVHFASATARPASGHRRHEWVMRRSHLRAFGHQALHLLSFRTAIGAHAPPFGGEGCRRHSSQNRCRQIRHEAESPQRGRVR